VAFCLTFGAEELSVSVMRQVLGDTLRGLGVAEDSVYDLLLAATEACTSVLGYGRPSVGAPVVAGSGAGAGAGAGYAVVTSLSGAGCRVEVTGPGRVEATPKRTRVRRTGLDGARLDGTEPDRAAADGTGLDGGAADGTGLDGGAAVGASGGRPSLAAGGGQRGLTVARACVDTMTLRRRPGRDTVVILRKHINWSWDAPLRRMVSASTLS